MQILGCKYFGYIDQKELFDLTVNQVKFSIVTAISVMPSMNHAFFTVVGACKNFYFFSKQEKSCGKC